MVPPPRTKLPPQDLHPSFAPANRHSPAAHPALLVLLLEHLQRKAGSKMASDWVLPEKFAEGLLDEKGEPLSKR